MKFEDKIKELESIAEKLSSEETTLDESISLYAKALEKSKECIDILNENKGKMKELSMQMDALFNGEDNAI